VKSVEYLLAPRGRAHTYRVESTAGPSG
jgi:hypothetical protein